MDRDEEHDHPVANVRWVHPETLHANNYNPNHVFGPERELLRTSIIEDGWTQPIVARIDGEIVDGFHRWTLGKTKEVQDACGPLVPVVFLRPAKSKTDQMFSTVRHNRARGQHGILAMSDIVQSLAAEGLDAAEIQKRMGMDAEEYERLAGQVRSPELQGKESFGRSWVPHLPAGKTRIEAHREGVAVAREKAASKKKRNGAASGT